mgnify:CR=1 FL=1
MLSGYNEDCIFGLWVNDSKSKEFHGPVAAVFWLPATTDFELEI